LLLISEAPAKKGFNLHGKFKFHETMIEAGDAAQLNGTKSFHIRFEGGASHYGHQLRGQFEWSRAKVCPLDLHIFGPSYIRVIH
jgi:hypothetical protein